MGERKQHCLECASCTIPLLLKLQSQNGSQRKACGVAGMRSGGVEHPRAETQEIMSEHQAALPCRVGDGALAQAAQRGTWVLLL